MKKILSLILIYSLLVTTAFAGGKIQNADVKSLAELTALGAGKPQLINDDKIYISANGINDQLSNAITNGQIGGSPSGSVNLLNGGFENGTTGWATYKDAAGSAPVDGTGGTPSITLTTTSTNPLYGKSSGVFTHPASNTQGEGASYDFTIDQALQAKVVTLSGSYKVTSGTYSGGTSSTDSDVTIYIYDKTNGVVIQPTGYKLDGGGILNQNYDFNATFQTASNSTSYRIIFHSATTSASAYVLNYDIAGISQAKSTNGGIISTPISFDPQTNSNGFGTLSGKTCFYTRNGNKALINCTFTASSCSAVEARMGLPFTIDSNYNPALAEVGGYGQSTSDTGGGQHVLAEAGANYLTFGYTSSASLSKRLASNLGTCGTFSINATVPVLGWGSTQTLSSDAGQRVVAFKAQTTSTMSIANNATPQLIYNTVLYDTHGAYSTSTNNYTAPEAGYYKVSGGYAATTSFASGALYLLLYKNGSLDSMLGKCFGTGGGGPVVYGSTTIKLNAGETVSLFASNSTGAGNALTGTLSDGYFTVEKVLGPTQIAASETVAASYWLSANFTASTTTPVNYDSKEYDTHGAVTTSSTAWKFTAPIAGLYRVGGMVYHSTVNNEINVYKNGTLYEICGYTANAAGSRGWQDCTLRLNAGDYIDLRPSASLQIQGAAFSANTASRITITRLGL